VTGAKDATPRPAFPEGVEGHAAGLRAQPFGGFISAMCA